MATYIGLYRWTEKGVSTAKDAPTRIEAAKKAAQALGGSVKGVYITMGQYDLVSIGEFPNDEAAAKFALSLGIQGNVSTQTLRAFTEEEFRKIVASLP